MGRSAEANMMLLKIQQEKKKGKRSLTIQLGTGRDAMSSRTQERVWLRVKGERKEFKGEFLSKQLWSQRLDGAKHLCISRDYGSNQGNNYTEEEDLLICLRHKCV